MGKLVEMTHVSLDGQIDELDKWAFPYLDEDHNRYASELLDQADALLLGRVGYEGMADAYLKMAEQAPPGTPIDFIERMNSIPKYVASRTGAPTPTWDATLIEHGLIDEFHLSLTPVAAGHGERLFERLDGAPRLELQELTRFPSGVVLLVYAPR